MLPVKKMSKTRTRSRRAHQALSPANYAPCPMCGQARLLKTACENCGFVNARVRLKQKAKKEE